MFEFTIFDIGMFDGEDTAYYLESGHQVVAVEANPAFVEIAGRRFAEAIAEGQLVCLHAAISADGGPTTLNLCGDAPGSSSLFTERLGDRHPVGTVTVPGTTMESLFDRFGIPEFVKVDIEGADRLCVLALTADRRPRFVSFEVGPDVEELVTHLQTIGYRGFKVVHQNSFRELANPRPIRDRVSQRLLRLMGYAEPRFIRRRGRYFVAGHSSGPVPWRSDGRWQTMRDILKRLRKAREAREFVGWYDVQARIY